MKIKYLRLSYDPFRPVPLQLRPFQSSSSPATTLSVQFPSSYDPFNPVPLQLRPFPSSSPPATTLSVQFPSSYDPFRPAPLQLIILPACRTDNEAKQAAKNVLIHQRPVVTICIMKFTI